MVLHILTVQVSTRAVYCKQWFNCAECHAESGTHWLMKTTGIVSDSVHVQEVRQVPEGKRSETPKRRLVWASHMTLVVHIKFHYRLTVAFAGRFHMK